MSDIQHIVSKVEETLTPLFKEIEETAYINQEKVLNAFHHVKASENDLVGSTGYGYDDFGRDRLERYMLIRLKQKMHLLDLKLFRVLMQLH